MLSGNTFQRVGKYIDQNLVFDQGIKQIANFRSDVDSDVTQSVMSPKISSAGVRKLLSYMYIDEYYLDLNTN